jgi:hypothetical protein
MARGRRTPAEQAALARAVPRLARLRPAPRPLRTGRVRILHVPWLFRLPWFRRFVGYTIGPLILLRRPLSEAGDDLIAHELCHVWQVQRDGLEMWLSYLYLGYDHNPYEVEARYAVDTTRAGSRDAAH